MMPNDLKTAGHLTGTKQVTRALKEERVLRVFLASDADAKVTGPVAELCREKNIPVQEDHTMAELGAACGIAVGSAVAAILK